MYKKTIITILTFVIVSLVPVSYASAGEFKITGSITDSTGALIDGASVTIECNGFSHTVTSKNGFYKSGFSNRQCPEGSTVTIEVTKDAMNGVASTTANTEDQVVNIVISEATEVPEFTTTTAILAMTASAGIYFLHKRGLLLAKN